MNANLRNFALWVIIVLLLLALFTLFQNPGQRASSQDISFSQLLTEVDQNHVGDVVIQGRKSTVPSPTAQASRPTRRTIRRWSPACITARSRLRRTPPATTGRGRVA